MRNWKPSVRPHWTAIVLGIVGALVGVGQGVVYFRQAAIMNIQTQITERQLAETRLEGRAWVTADIQVANPLAFTKNGTTQIDLLLRVRNIGKIPALAVVPYLSVIPSLLVGREQAQREQCTQRTFGGTTLFPGDQRLMQIGTGIEPHEFWQKYPKLQPTISPIVFLCIIYRMPDEATEHHTPFVLALVRKHTDVEGRFASVIYTDEGSVPVDNLQLLEQLLLYRSAPD